MNLSHVYLLCVNVCMLYVYIYVLCVSLSVCLDLSKWVQCHLEGSCVRQVSGQSVRRGVGVGRWYEDTTVSGGQFKGSAGSLWKLNQSFLSLRRNLTLLLWPELCLLYQNGTLLWVSFGGRVIGVEVGDKHFSEQKRNMNAHPWSRVCETPSHSP